MLKKILCRFGEILTIGFAAGILLSTRIMVTLNNALANDLFKIIGAGLLISLGFWLSQRCEEETCKT